MDTALKNARHERFAQNIAAEMMQEAANEAAGYAPNRHNASRLKTNETIRGRVGELQTRTAHGLNYDRQWFLEEQIRLYRHCREMGAPMATNTAPMQAAVFAGHWAERKEDDQPDNDRPARIERVIVEPNQGQPASQGTDPSMGKVIPIPSPL